MRSKAPAQFLSSAHNKVHILFLSSSSLPTALPYLRNTSTLRKNGHGLKTFKAENLSPSLKCNVSHYRPTFSSLFFSGSKGLWVNSCIHLNVDEFRACHWIQWISKHNRKRPFTTFRDVASQALVNFKCLMSLCTAYVYVWQRLLLLKQQQQEPTHQVTWPSLHLTNRWINWTYAVLNVFRFHFPVNSLFSLGTYPAKKTSVSPAVWVHIRMKNHRST
jgi:hypothetical protein